MPKSSPDGPAVCERILWAVVLQVKDLFKLINVINVGCKENSINDGLWLIANFDRRRSSTRWLMLMYMRYNRYVKIS